MDSLVSSEWLYDHLNDPDLIVLDCSVETLETEHGLNNISGFAGYLGEHIPGAGFADLKGGLSDSSNPIEFTPPSAELFCEEMSKLGVGDDSKVVLYDRSIMAWASRIWWMLKWVGFDNAALLDGGLSGWKSAGRTVEKGPVDCKMNVLTPNPRPHLIANRDEVLLAIDDGAVCLVDTMPKEIFEGGQQMYARPGHIKSAINLPALSALDESGHFKQRVALEELYQGVDREKRQITYCGGGILASQSAFVMQLIGFSDVAVYTASLQEWATDLSNPMEISHTS